MKKIIACIAVAAAVLSGCSKESNTTVAAADESGILEFTGIVPDTRTYLGGNHGSDRDVLWSAGDKLTIWSDVKTPLTYVLTAGADSTEGTFTYTPTVAAPSGITGSEIYAIYPQSPKTSVSGNEAYIELPSVQTCTKVANFDQNYNPMAAIAKDNVSKLTFQNLCSIIVIKVTPDQDLTISKIVLDSESTSLCGSATVSFAGTTPTMTVAAGQNTLTINTNSIGKLNANQEYIFYAVVPAGEYNDLGIKIFTDKAEERGAYSLYKVRTATMNLKAGEVTAIGATFGLNTIPLHQYKIGEKYPFGENKEAEGIVFALDNEDGTSGRIVALQDCSTDGNETYKFTETPTAVTIGSTDQNNGLTNQNSIPASELSNYPAFAACAALTTGGLTWYLPAVNELRAISSNYGTLEATWRTITSAGEDQYMLDGNYYSSTVSGTRPATKKVYVYAAEADEFTNSLIKEVNSGNHRVRAVAQFVEKK